MSRPSPSGPSIPRLLERLSNGNARDALHASEALAQLAAAGPAEALRLAQCGAVPALVQAVCGPNGAVIANAGAALVAVAGAAPGLVADAASSALVAALRGENRHAARGAAQVFRAIAGRTPERVAAAPGALQALSSALCGTAVDTIDGAARALCYCARASPALARLVADTPGALAAMVGVVASSNASDAANSSVVALLNIAVAGADLAARVINHPGAPQALSQAALQFRDVQVANCAAAVLVKVADAGLECASTIASPDVLAALVSASGRAGMGVECMAALSKIAAASLPLALRVADTPGAEAAVLAALTLSDVNAAGFAALVLSTIWRVDAGRCARLLSGPEVPPALARLLQSNDATAVQLSTSLLSRMEEYGLQMVSRLPRLPGTVLQAWATMLGGANAPLALAAARALHGLARTGDVPAMRVFTTPGFSEAVASALGNTNVATSTLSLLGAMAASNSGLAVCVASIAEVFPALARALQSPKPAYAINAARVLSFLCAAHARLARQAVAAPGVLRSLVAMLQGPGDETAFSAVCVLAGMVEGGDHLRRPNLASRFAAEDGLLPALAAFARRASGQEAIQAVHTLAIIACSGGDGLASLVDRTEGAIPALVRALREGEGTRVASTALDALLTIAAASPQHLGRRIQDAGAADAVVRLAARAHGGLAPPQAPVVDSAAALLKILAASQAAMVTAALAGLLARGGTAANAFARDLLAAAPLSLGPVAIQALARQAEAAAQGRARAAALEALAAASAAEADPARPRFCVACGQQREATGTGRLRPCAGCSGKGPAGRVLYCGADCQRGAASPQDLQRRVLDAGAADAAVSAVARAHGRLAPPSAAGVAEVLGVMQLGTYAAALLQALAELDAATVTAALARLLAPGGAAAGAFARSCLAAAPQSLGPVAIEALARQAEAAAQARARGAALEALTAASAVETDAARPRLCAACGLQHEVPGGGRLWPCAGCSGRGPAGRVLYCGADCQRAHWPAHRAYCKAAAAATAPAHGGPA